MPCSVYLWELHSVFSVCAQDRAAGGPCRSSQVLKILFLGHPGQVIHHLVLSSRFKPRYREWPSGVPSIWVALPCEEEECRLESCALPLLSGNDPSWLGMICWTKSLLRHQEATAYTKWNQASQQYPSPICRRALEMKDHM